MEYNKSEIKFQKYVLTSLRNDHKDKFFELEVIVQVVI